MKRYIKSNNSKTNIIAATTSHPAVPAGWKVVPEGDDDEGNWTTVVKELPNHSGYIWLDMFYDDRDKRYYELQVGYRKADRSIGEIFKATSKRFYRLGDALKYAQKYLVEDSEVFSAIKASSYDDIAAGHWEAIAEFDDGTTIEFTKPCTAVGWEAEEEQQADVEQELLERASDVGKEVIYYTVNFVGE